MNASFWSVLNFMYLFLLMAYQAQVRVEKCKENITYQRPFDAFWMEGRWYEAATTRRQNKNWKCVQIVFGEYEAPLQPYHRLYIDLDDNKRPKEEYIEYNLIFPNEGTGVTFGNYDWHLIQSDYKNFAFFYNCNRFTKMEFISILTRDRFNNTILTTLSSYLLKQYNFTADDVTVSKQIGCPDIQVQEQETNDHKEYDYKNNYNK